jgi:hypothetical protein
MTTVTPTIGRHTCHAKSCTVEVPPAMFMCKPHWYRLPRTMRRAVWVAYVPGQEVRKDPSAHYLQVARTAIDYLARLEEAS